MSNRKIVLAVCAAALVLAGCGSTVGGEAAANEEPAEPVAESTPAPPTEEPAGGGGDGKLTPTGTTLKVGQTARVLYEVKDLAKETTTLAITTKSVVKGSVDDMKNFNLDAQTKASDPFYVTVTFKNVGTKPMEPGGIFGLIKAINTNGDELGSLTLLGDFDKCGGLPPKKLGVGKSYTQCDIYIAPSGQEVSEVEFGHFVGTEETEIKWTVS